MMLWALLLPWMHLLWVMLLLIATSTIVVVPCEIAVAAPAAGFTTSPGTAAARMSNNKRVGWGFPSLLV